MDNMVQCCALHKHHFFFLVFVSVFTHIHTTVWSVGDIFTMFMLYINWNKSRSTAMSVYVTSYVQECNTIPMDYAYA